MNWVNAIWGMVLLMVPFVIEYSKNHAARPCPVTVDVDKR